MPPDGAAAPPSFPIFGIGASAGGLAAFDAFLSAIPTERDSGIAYVLVQHRSPDHKSVLSDLCQRHTRIPVMEVTDGLLVLPNRIYIIPPNHDLALLDGRLHLLEPAAPRGLRLPIDFFFRSLAQDRQERAITVVLSGTGSDGTLGARAVKGAGGLVMAQLPASAAYDGMPRRVIATDLDARAIAQARRPMSGARPGRAPGGCGAPHRQSQPQVPRGVPYPPGARPARRRVDKRNASTSVPNASRSATRPPGPAPGRSAGSRPQPPWPRTSPADGRRGPGHTRCRRAR